MQTIEKKYYVCEICGKTAQDAEKIRACQEMHRNVSDGTVEPHYRKGKTYPKSIVISFEDGSQVEYYYNYSTDANGKTVTVDA